MRTNCVCFGIKHFVYLSTRHDISCEHCNFKTRALNLTKAINHYIEEHKYVLVHAGERCLGEGKNVLQYTFAILGK